ncbi:MAG: hypothetical protein Q4B28_02480 [bacterium]|nr:hypothetical protein [bacterium]
MQKNTIITLLLVITILLSGLLIHNYQTRPTSSIDIQTSLAEQPITALWDAIATKSASRYHTLKTTPQQTAEGYTLTSPLLDQEHYYKISKEEQLELFYLQRTSTNRSYPLPIFPMMEVEFEPGESCILQEDEGIFTLGHQGTLDFFSPQMRYPFKLKASHFKHFRLKGKVNQ